MRISESMSIKEFMSRDFKKELEIERIQVRKRIIKITLRTGIILFCIMATSDISYAEGMESIDEKAQSIYTKLLTIGKWFIIVKGALQTINKLLQGEDKAAMKSFLSYLAVYVILKGLPWAFDQVDEVFKGMK